MAFTDFTIDTFRAQMEDGGARASLFSMEVNFPALVVAALNQKKVQYFCRVSEIPGSQQNFITQKVMGRELKFTGQRTFTNLTVTILNDENYTVRNYMDAWMDIINGKNSNLALADQGVGLEGSGVVTQFTKTGTAQHQYTFRGMFPVNIAPVALDWSNDAAIEEYTVEFAYQYWTKTK